MQVLVWSDYICPWCYLGRDRNDLLRSLGVDVVPMPFELHPDIPPEGRTVRPGGRLDAVHQEISRLCAEVGLELHPPARVPNSRLALETAEVVRGLEPEAFPALDDALFRAHFVERRALDDPAVIDELVNRAGARADEVRSAVAAGRGAAAITDTMARARDHGVAGTPAWLFPPELVVPGAQPRELFVRIVARLRSA